MPSKRTKTTGTEKPKRPVKANFDRDVQIVAVSFNNLSAINARQHTDFILEIKVDSLTQLDTTFAHLMEDNDLDTRAYELLHDMIRDAKVGLYRPYPSAKQRERVALI